MISPSAGTFASDVTYHPNGAVKGFAYGNNIVHTMSQNDRMLPRASQDGGILRLVNDYDKNANVTRIGDEVRGIAYSPIMYYDGLNRLTDAGAAMFGGRSLAPVHL